ncbi:HDOD domain-containing protein [Hydrogenophaga sp. RWCD_12]|uniref:HDOD domain-containing protein n=1 Tax=Hydrogenophaga sp. RWCD_12 TaxID=3391190 RepID=UPI0039854E22
MTAADFFKDLTLPTMPQVAHDLIRSLNEEDVPLSHLREAIARDPALAVHLLRLANSAHYGAREKVGTIEDAIARVGTAQVRALALAAMFNDAFPVTPGLDRQAFWRESQERGGMAQWLASGVGTDGQQAWLTGFMVRVGELLMGMKSPNSVAEFEREPRFPGARWERESSLFGFTEGEVSAELARAWNFPDEMIHALDAAAKPLAAQPFSRLGAVLHVAELLAAVPSPSLEAIDELPADVLEALEVDADWMRNRLPQAQRYVEASRLH